MKELPPVKRLAHAIALQAVNDYRTALGGADVEGRNCDSVVRECDGYCDKSSHKIVINTENGDLDDFPRYQKQCLRHEIIHAFMFESGLGANWEHKPIGQEETTVDWIAVQFPKLLEVFEKAGAL